MENINQHALKTLSCFFAVTFYSASHLCNDQCFLHDNFMSVLYFLFVIAKPLFFIIIGYMDEERGVTRKYIFLKIKSIVLIVFFWNLLFFFIDSSLFQRGYLLQNEILMSIAIIYFLQSVISRFLNNLTLILGLMCVFMAISIFINLWNVSGADFTQIQLPGYFDVWVLIAYYQFGRLMGSVSGQAAARRRAVVATARLGVAPLALALYFYEKYLSSHAFGNIVPWFILEHLIVMLLCILLFTLFENMEIKKKFIIRFVGFVSPTMVGVYIVHYSVFYLFATAYDLNNVTLRFTLLVAVFLVSVIISRLLLLNKHTSRLISL